MKVEKVTFDKKFGMPNYGSDHPGVVEAILENGETMEEAWTKLNQRMIDWHMNEYPHLYHSQIVATVDMRTQSSQPTPTIDRRRDEQIEISIDNCTTLEELGALKKDLPNSLITTYMNKLKALTQ